MKTELNPETVGRMCLEKMHTSLERYPIAIDLVALGEASIQRRKVIIAIEGGEWVLMHYSMRNVEAARGHGYLVKGRKVFPIHAGRPRTGEFGAVMRSYEGECREKPLAEMSAREIFSAGRGFRSRKKVTEHVDRCAKTYIRTKRYGYNTITIKTRG